jgi:hypothetical protein
MEQDGWRSVRHGEVERYKQRGPHSVVAIDGPSGCPFRHHLDVSGCRQHRSGGSLRSPSLGPCSLRRRVPPVSSTRVPPVSPAWCLWPPPLCPFALLRQVGLLFRVPLASSTRSLRSPSPGLSVPSLDPTGLLCRVRSVSFTRSLRSPPPGLSVPARGPSGFPHRDSPASSLGSLRCPSPGP